MGEAGQGISVGGSKVMIKGSGASIGRFSGMLDDGVASSMGEDEI